ncbi:MAG: HlyC/CorC family transporter [Deltaproteobacteria bacterium]|nr:HlyC/CorC family transporter [Deltaproteobacteria bacterium]
MIPLVFLFFIFLCFSAFFSSSETALFSLSKVHIHKFKHSKGFAARKVVECLCNPRHILVTILLGNEFVNIAMSIIGASIVSQLFPHGAYAETLLAVVIVTPVILIFGEIVPKNIALRFSRELAPVIVVPLRVFHVAITPLRIVLASIADGVIRIFGGSPENSSPMMMEQEFRQLIDLGKKEGVIIAEEHELIHNVFEFAGKVVCDIMTPKLALMTVSVDIPFTELLACMKKENFSRVPVYECQPENIIGILHVRDLFTFDRKRRTGSKDDIRELLHKPIFVGGNESIEVLLRKIQSSRMHMALVQDEQGSLIGVATLHDVLTELFGEMRE